MSVSKLTKYINLALNNSSEGESSTAARMFFKKLTSLDMKFNPKTFSLTRSQACRLADLADKVFKGLNDGSESEVKQESTSSANSFYADNFKSVRQCCYYYFSMIDMTNSKERRDMINMLVTVYSLDKRSVQSYASNFRAGKWR